MARQTLTKQVPKGPYPSLPVAANALDLAFTAANPTDKEEVVPSSDMLLIVWNSHASNAYTYTLTSGVDERNRTGDVTGYSLGAGEHAFFRYKKAGWAQTNGKINFEAENAAIKFAVIQL